MNNTVFQYLEELKQKELLAYLSGLPQASYEKMLAQISALDMSVFDTQAEAARGEISPCFTMKRESIEEKRELLETLGRNAIREGKIAAVMLAGGLGSRLGFSHPKGTLNIGISKPLYVFECQIKNLLKVCDEVQCWIPLFIMTSEDNHEETVSFIENHGYFGYSPESVWFFKQEQLPVLDEDNNLLLADSDTILTAPNGNGGWYSSLASSELQQVIRDFGIEWLNVFAVDNVLQKIADPLFLGAVIEMNWKCGAKVVKKTSPDERVGTLCTENGTHPTIVEYYEMNDDMRYAKNSDGSYVYDYGVILNYLFRVDQLDGTLNVKLPLHKAHKKMTYLGYDGIPKEGFVNKFETLALDLINLQGECLPFEVIREEEFAPIKNKEGSDSVETAQKLLELNGIIL